MIGKKFICSLINLLNKINFDAKFFKLFEIQGDKIGIEANKAYHYQQSKYLMVSNNSNILRRIKKYSKDDFFHFCINL